MSNISGIPPPRMASNVWKEQDVGKLAQEAFFISKGKGFAKTPPKFPRCLLWRRQTNPLSRRRKRRQRRARPRYRRRRGRAALTSSLSLGSVFAVTALWRINQPVLALWGRGQSHGPGGTFHRRGKRPFGTELVVAGELRPPLR